MLFRMFWFFLSFFLNFSAVQCNICTLCDCAFVNLTTVEAEPLENFEIIAFKYRMDSVEPYNVSASYDFIEKYFYVNCASDMNVGKINNLKWPMLKVLGIFGNFKKSQWKRLEYFPDNIKQQLSVLSVSENLIQEVDSSELHDFNNLRMLNLSRNKLESIKKSTFGKMTSLIILDLSKNLISEVNEWAFYGTKLKYLNLSKNSLTHLSANVFSGLKNLLLLDLSYNKLVKLSENFQMSLTSLRTLLLSGNALNNLPEMPKKLKKLNLRMNGFTKLILSLSELEVLDIGENEISSLADLKTPVLKVIKIDNNNFTDFINLRSQWITTIDLSYNQFNEFPKDLTSNSFYYLQNLYLDGNPLRGINFPSQNEPFQNLRFISMTHSKIQELRKNSFEGAFTKYQYNCTVQEGISLNFSHSLVKIIDNEAFEGFSVCTVDLSYNNLETLSQSSLPWKNMLFLNLQGNPWNCDCKIQWMLQDYMAFMYKKNPKVLLDLRCATPQRYKQKMFVSWYNRTENAFCKSPSSILCNMIGGTALETWTVGAIICVILASFILLIIIIILVLYYTKPSKKKKKQKRFRSGRLSDYRLILKKA